MIYGKMTVTQQLVLKMSYQVLDCIWKACFRRQEHFQNTSQTQCLSF